MRHFSGFVFGNAPPRCLVYGVVFANADDNDQHDGFSPHDLINDADPFFFELDLQKSGEI